MTYLMLLLLFFFASTLKPNKKTVIDLNIFKITFRQLKKLAVIALVHLIKLMITICLINKNTTNVSFKFDKFEIVSK
jgi:hypothetical protein